MNNHYAKGLAIQSLSEDLQSASLNGDLDDLDQESREELKSALSEAVADLGDVLSRLHRHVKEVVA